MTTRPMAVSGSFYPSEPQQLQQMIDDYLEHQDSSFTQSGQANRLKALIVPHAGYIYSGRVAASAYRLLQQRKDIQRIVLLGPNHRVPLHGMALPSNDFFSTPLGDIAIDTDSVKQLSLSLSYQILDAAHQLEHCLEVQLPFLQTVLKDFLLLPIVVGATEPDTVAELIKMFWPDNHTFFIISTDLSHFHPYSEACRIDRNTSQLIESKSWHLHGEQACGASPLNGLLKFASQRESSIRTLELLNSGDTAGDKDRVVGYGAYAVSE